MVVGAFPLAKLGILAVKQISKPVNAIIRRAAQKFSFFKSYVVAPTAQFYNKIEVRSKMWMLNMSQPSRIPPLSSDMATKMGSDILSELLVFIIGVSLILGEFSRQRRKDERKHEKHKAQRALLRQRIEELTERVSDQDKQLKDLKAEYAKRYYYDQECS